MVGAMEEWMEYFKGHSVPGVTGSQGQEESCSYWDRDIYGTLCKEVAKEGTYQLKRRRLLPDVKDPPEQGTVNVDMMDI